MKKHFLIALLSTATWIHAQEPIYSVSSPQFFQNQTKTPPQKTAHPSPIAANNAKANGMSEIMIIPPESRAQDLLSAFQYLRKMSTATKVGVKLTDGSLITEILDMELMPGGTLIIFKINSLKGQIYKVVKIEMIDTLANV